VGLEKLPVDRYQRNAVTFGHGEVGCVVEGEAQTQTQGKGRGCQGADWYCRQMEAHERAKSLKGDGLRHPLPADRQHEGVADFMQEKVGDDYPDVTDDVPFEQG